MDNNMSMDTTQIEKILSVVKLMNNMNNNDTNNNETENNVAIVEKMDAATALARVKEAVPFLDMPYQRTIGYMLKLIEIEKLMNTFKTMSVSGENNNNAKRRLLMAIRPQLDMRKQKMVDMFVKVMEIGDIMEDFTVNE